MLSRRIALAVAVLLACAFMIGSATGIQRTVVSLFVREATGEAVWVFAPLISFGVFKGVLGLVGGEVCDALGRRKALLIGLVTYAAGVWIILARPTPDGIVIGNSLVGAGEGLVFLAAMTGLADVYGAEEAGLSFGAMEALAYAGYGFGSLLAGLLWGAWGPIAPFNYAFAASLVILGFALLLCKETRQLSIREGEKWGEVELSTVEAYSACLTKPSLLASYFAAHVAKFADALVWAVFPLIFALRGFSKEEIGLLQGLVTLAWSASMPVWGKFSDKVGRKALIAGGFTLYTFALILFLNTKHLIDTAVSVTLLGLANGMYYPLLPAVTADLAPLGARGRALGLYRSMRDFGYLTGAAFLALLLKSVGVYGAFEVVVFLTGLSAVTSLLLVRETRPFWPFFDLVVEHALLMREVLLLNGELLRSMRDGDVERAHSLAKEVKNLERKADHIRREIMDKIWSSTLPLSDRMDFERLVEVVDRVASHVLESHERLFRIDVQSVPRQLLDGLVELNGLTAEAADAFIENIKMLRKFPRIAARLADAVDKAETKVDLLRMRLLDEIRVALRRGEIDVLAAIDLRDAIDLLEEVADELEDASDIVRIISVKHAR